MTKRYVIVFPNDPQYKGMDCYYVTLHKQTSDLQEAAIFTKKEDAVVKRYWLEKEPLRVKGHLLPEIWEVELTISLISPKAKKSK